MRLKYIVVGSIAIIFIAVAWYSFDSSAIEYSNFNPAKTSGKKVQIIGSWVKDKPSEYVADKDLFTFYMLDKENHTAKVIYHGAKPNNFNIANFFVCKGSFHGDDFEATEILTKCPSKYENSIKDLQKQDLQNQGIHNQ